MFRFLVDDIKQGLASDRPHNLSRRAYPSSTHNAPLRHPAYHPPHLARHSPTTFVLMDALFEIAVPVPAEDPACSSTSVEMALVDEERYGTGSTWHSGCTIC